MLAADLIHPSAVILLLRGMAGHLREVRFQVEREASPAGTADQPPPGS